MLMEEVLHGNGSAAITESRSLLPVARITGHREHGGISGGSGWEEGVLVDCSRLVL